MRFPSLLPSLKVLTYNTHHGEGTDGLIDIQRIASVILDSGADIAAIQEVDVNIARTGQINQAIEYTRLTGLYGQYGKAIDFQGGAYGQLLLSRWPIHDFQIHLLPNPRKREQRIALSARLFPPGQTPFRFVSIHLDSTPTDEDRWLQAACLLELFNQPEESTIMAGDFNDTPNSRVLLRLVEKWIDTSSKSPMLTMPAENPVNRIDFILCRPSKHRAFTS